MTDRVGQQLGNYRVLRLLGRGGFSEVYLGEHVYLKSHAALKVLHTRLGEQDAEQFLREAQTLAHLDHPHIVRVLDFAVQDGMPFLVMEYAVGGTLRQRHPTGTHLPLEQIIAYVSQVASALQYAHNQRLIHRDVKPELLGAREELLLGDFGLAMLTPSTRSGSTQAMDPAMAGTAPYLAPEQVQGQPRPASDQYALGVVVYEWLCGQRPFRGTPIEVALQQVSAPPPSLHEKLPIIAGVMVLPGGVFLFWWLWWASKVGWWTLGNTLSVLLQTFILFPLFFLIYLLVPASIAGLFNTLRTNGVIGEHRRHQPGTETYETFVHQLVYWMDRNWWTAATLIIILFYALYRLLLLEPRSPSLVPYWFRVSAGEEQACEGSSVQE